MAARLANPLNAKAVELGDQAASVHKSVMDAQKSGDDTAQMQAAIEGNAKLKNIAGQLARLTEQAQSQSRSTARMDKVASQVQAMRTQIAALVL